MKNILVVDDEQEILDAIEDSLKSAGFRVVTMTDGKSALSAIRGGERVDLVITDYAMQGMDGLEFLSRLKEITPSVPVIILTGRVSIECYLKSLSMGAIAYVTKPFEAKELERIVKDAFVVAGSGRTSPRTLPAS